MDDAKRDWISGRTAAKILGVTPKTVAAWTRAGKLASLAKLDGSVFVFERHVVEAKAQELKQAAQAA